MAASESLFMDFEGKKRSFIVYKKKSFGKKKKNRLRTSF